MRVAEHAHGILTRTGLSRREIRVAPTPLWAKLRDTVVDRLFSEPSLAALYDRFCPWEPRGDFSFYLPLVMSADAVLDVGCGTGALLRGAREAGHTGRLCGLDPAGGCSTKRARARTSSGSAETSPRWTGPRPIGTKHSTSSS